MYIQFNDPYCHFINIYIKNDLIFMSETQHVNGSSNAMFDVFDPIQITLSQNTATFNQFKFFQCV